MYSLEYNGGVFTIKHTDEFNAWLLGLKDGPTHRRLLVRLRRASMGNLGDVKSVGGGVYEMREDFGPSWRMYYGTAERCRSSCWAAAQSARAIRHRQGQGAGHRGLRNNHEQESQSQ